MLCTSTPCSDRGVHHSSAYVFLASPVCSGYITGLVLAVAGSIDAA